MIGIDLIKQQALGADSKQYNKLIFCVSLDRAAIFFFIIEKAREL